MSSFYYVQLLFSFFIVGVCMYFFYRFTKKYKDKKFSGDIEIVDRCSLDNSNQLVVVKVNGSKLLLAAGSKGVSFLKEVGHSSHSLDKSLEKVLEK